MAISTMDGLIAALPGQIRPIFKTAFSPQAAGAYYSPWLITGQSGAGAAPSSGIGGDVPTDATAGAIPFVNASSGSTYLGRSSLAAAVTGTLIIFDRLFHNSGVSATLTSGQTVNSTALTRPDANGADVEAWWQVYATMGAGTPTVTLSYTDQDGNSGASATSGALVTTMAVGRTGPFTLAAGDSGVRSVQTWTNSATFTSGTIGLVLRRRLATIPFTLANVAMMHDAIALGMPEIYDDACIEFVWLATATTSNNFNGELNIIEG